MKSFQEDPSVDPVLLRQLAELRDETITEDDFESLEKRLASDGKAREVYLRFMQVHSLLESDIPLPDLGDYEQEKPTHRLRKPGAFEVSMMALAAAIAVAFTILIQASRSGEVPEMVATLILAENCVWDGDDAPSEGEPLAAGALSLQRGDAIIRFDGGAEVLLSGRTKVLVEDDNHAELEEGSIIVRAESVERFTVGTPVGELIDLGTEFAVRVRDAGLTELHVLDGEVEYHAEKSQDRGSVTAGHAILLDPRGAEPMKIVLNSPGFEKALQKAGPKSRADLMRVYDGFHYDEGSLALEESVRGKGWAGPWRLRKDEERRQPFDEPGDPYLRIVHGELNVTWPVQGGRLGMLEMPGDAIFVRELERSIQMDKDQIFYFSLMVQEPGEPAEKWVKGEREGIRLTLRSSEDYFGKSLSFGYGHKYHPHIQAGGQQNFRSPILAPSSQTTLWVGKVICRAEGEDEVFFRIYGEGDFLDYAEPDVWHTVSRGLDLSAGFDRVLLTSTGKGKRIVDELRFGPTWRSVAPMQR